MIPQPTVGAPRWLTAAVVAALLALFATAGSFALRNHDLWFHLAAGRWMLEHGEVLRSDPFSLTAAGEPWIAHEWGFEILAALVEDAGGVAALVAARAVLVLLIVPLALAACRAAGAGTVTAAALLGYWVLMSQIWLYARPQVVTYLLLAASLAILMRWKYHGGRILWAFPPLLLIWVNLHAGFLAGLLLLALFLAGEALQSWKPLLRRDPSHAAAPGEAGRLALVTGASVLATLVNPYGPRIYLLPLQITGSDYLQSMVEEWLPSWDARFAGDPDVWMFWAALVLSPAILLVHGRRRDLTHLLVVAVFGWMALRSVRHVPVFGVIALPLVARSLTAAIAHGKLSPLRSARAAMAAAAAVAALLAAGAAWGTARGFPGTGRTPFDFRVDGSRIPVETLDWMEERGVDGRAFNAYVFGGYLAYRQFPRTRVSMDGRNEVYGEARVREHYDALADPAVFESFDGRWNVEIVLLDARRRDLDDPLFRHLLASPAWSLVRTDPLTNLFVRRIPRFAGVAAEGW